MADRRTILCMASYFKGERFLTTCKEQGAHTILLTAQSLLGEPWPRDCIDELFGLPNFQDLRGVLALPLALLGRGVTGPHVHRDKLAGAEPLDPRERGAQVALDVIGQRLEG